MPELPRTIAFLSERGAISRSTPALIGSLTCFACQLRRATEEDTTPIFTPAQPRVCIPTGYTNALRHLQKFNQAEVIEPINNGSGQEFRLTNSAQATRFVNILLGEAPPSPAICPSPRVLTDPGAATVAERIVEIMQELVRRRREAGLTQHEVAAALGCHQPAVANLEGSCNPQLQTVLR